MIKWYKNLDSEKKAIFWRGIKRAAYLIFMTIVYLPLVIILRLLKIQD